MYKSVIISSGFHIAIIFLAALSLPFISKKPIELPPLISIELIQITDETNIPYAPKAKKTIEKVKKEKEKLLSEQAPPKKIKKVTWGDTTGLKVKLNDKEARKSFAARHKCAQQKDKTSAAYWACNLPRYAKSLGLSGGGNFFW